MKKQLGKFVENHRVNKHIVPGSKDGLFKFSSSRQEITVRSYGDKNQLGWEHVVIISSDKKPINCETLKAVKKMFWDPEEIVIQFFCERSNESPGVVHLWKQAGVEYNLPIVWV